MFIFELGRDILRKLINECCDAKTAFNCLFVCKKFNECVNKNIVIRNYLKFLMYERNISFIKACEKCTCPKCHFYYVQETEEQRNSFWKKHMQKHYLTEKLGHVIHVNKKSTNCPHCELPYLGQFSEHLNSCLLKITECCASSRKCDFVRSLCKKVKGYKNEMRQHKCYIFCKLCKELITYHIDDDYWKILSHHIRNSCKIDKATKDKLHQTHSQWKWVSIDYTDLRRKSI